MKILLDENPSPTLVPKLGNLGIAAKRIGDRWHLPLIGLLPAQNSNSQALASGHSRRPENAECLD